jgi:hypothetical protein
LFDIVSSSLVNVPSAGHKTPGYAAGRLVLFSEETVTVIGSAPKNRRGTGIRLAESGHY